jgi:hypothetical protein
MIADSLGSDGLRANNLAAAREIGEWASSGQ